ncbi:MAG: MFS transporter [Proteobacteria bacterium]|nr:MFS transporter [Pseudomonadota bacterium]
MKNTINIRQLIFYSILSLPLSFIGLPLYIHLPKFYAEYYGISLTVIGNILLLLRIFDAFLDPMLGHFSDKYQLGKRKYLLTAALMISISFNALFWLPDYFYKFSPSLWFAFFTSLTYFFYSFININFYALGINLTDDYQERTKISAYREAAALFGVLLAAILPSLLLGYFSESVSFQIYGLIFALMIIVAILVLPKIENTNYKKEKSGFKELLILIKKRKEIFWLYILFFVNSLPVAITSTLFLYYVEHVLKLQSASGLLLALYFFSAALSTPCWSYLGKYLSKKNSLIFALVISLLSFTGCYFLNQHNNSLFYLICFLSGIGLGGEMVIFPSILADKLAEQKQLANSSFGIWQALSKISLGVAAGLVLPLLSFYGFQPNLTNTAHTLEILIICYSVLPLVIKFVWLTILILSPIDRKV